MFPKLVNCAYSHSDHRNVKMIMIMIAEQSYIMKENYKVQSLNTNSV